MSIFKIEFVFQFKSNWVLITMMFVKILFYLHLVQLASSNLRCSLLEKP